MGTFKKVERKVCPECNGFRSTASTVPNPNPPPTFFSWMTDKRTEEYQNNKSMVDEYFNYSKTQTVFTPCSVCSGTGEVFATAKDDPDTLPSLKRSESKIPKPTGPDFGDQDLSLQIKARIDDCNEEIKALLQSTSSGNPYLPVKYLLEESLKDLNLIHNRKEKDLISSFNYLSSRFFVELESVKKFSDAKNKALLESLYHNFNRVLYLKAKQLGMKYAFRELYDLKIYFLDYWN